MISKKFFKASLIYTVAGALPMASAVILLPFYFAGLSTELYGKLSIFLALALFVQIIVTYSFDSSIYVHYHEYKKDNVKLGQFVSSAFILMLIIGVVLGVVLAFTGHFLFELIAPDKNISFYPYGLASVTTGIFQALFKVYSSFLQTRQKPERFFWANCALFTLIATLTIVGLTLFPNTMMGPIWGRFIAFGFAALWVTLMIAREYGLSMNFAWLRQSLSYNNYVFLYQLEQWIINYFDRILMVFFLPLAAVGVYDFAVKCLVVVELLMNGLHNSFYPRVVNSIVTEKLTRSTPEINRYYHGLIAVVMVVTCGSVVGFPFAIDLFDGSSGYGEAIDYIPYVAAIYFPRVVKIYFSVPYSATKYTKPLPLIYLVISAVKIGLLVILIQHYQVYGVIIATAFASVVEVVLLRYVIRSRFHFSFNSAKILWAPAAMFLIIIIGEIFLSDWLSYVRFVSYLFICIAILWMLYSREMVTMFRTILTSFKSHS